MKPVDEVTARLRRIETILHKMMAGEPNAPKYTTEVFNTSEGWELEVNSTTISLQSVIDAARAAGVADGDTILVCDNGKPRVFVELMK